MVSSLLFSGEPSKEKNLLDSVNISSDCIHYQTAEGEHFLFRNNKRKNKCALLECYNFAKNRFNQNDKVLDIIELLQNKIIEEYPFNHKMHIDEQNPIIQRAFILSMLKKYKNKPTTDCKS